jgi:hypothetical protein
MTPATQPWNPSKGVRLLIGAATAWPIIYFGLFMSFIGFSFLRFSKTPPARPDMFEKMFAFLFPVHCLTMLVTFALMAVYIIHAVRNDRLTQEMRIVWLIILFMGNMFAFPVYWWFHLRPGAAKVGPPAT